MPQFAMTLTLSEFERQLRPLLTGWRVDQLGEGWRLRQETLTVDIRCRSLAALQLGALALPRVAVSVGFGTGSDPAQEAEFIEDFMRCFRRGGG